MFPVLVPASQNGLLSGSCPAKLCLCHNPSSALAETSFFRHCGYLIAAPRWNQNHKPFFLLAVVRLLVLSTCRATGQRAGSSSALQEPPRLCFKKLRSFVVLLVVRKSVRLCLGLPSGFLSFVHSSPVGTPFKSAQQLSSLS